LSFSDLKIWSDRDISFKLSWYLGVANNKFPAKYLIARRIPVIIDLNQPTEKLWEVHSNATNEFLKLKEEIQYKNKNLLETSIPPISLMDLNVELVKRMLKHCNFCRWDCKVDRSSSGNKTGTCQLGPISKISTYFHHKGEELIFRGLHGSGTIFFTSCNMRCCFCQNGDISTDKENGVATTPNELALMSWILRVEGCHNINFVGGDPTIHLHTIIEAISLFKHFTPSESQLHNIIRNKSDKFIKYTTRKQYGDYMGEFNVPILWNSNFFMSVETMRILRTVVDVWLPDFKFGKIKKCSQVLSRTPWYFETITNNHLLIDQWGEDYSIRHLIMPNHIECCTKPILTWIKMNIPDALVNIMDQYHPDNYTDPKSLFYNDRFEPINRRLSKSELESAYNYAKELEIKFELITFERYL